MQTYRGHVRALLRDYYPFDYLVVNEKARFCGLFGDIV